MRIALLFVAWVTAALALPATGAAESAADIFQRLGLLGTWAVDCARPPSLANPHVVYGLIDGPRVQRRISTAPGTIVELGTIDTAAETSPTELIISWQTSQGGLTNRILLGDGWMRVEDSTRHNGEKLFVNGRRVHDNAEAPRFVRCRTGQSASAQVPKRPRQEGSRLQGAGFRRLMKPAPEP